MVLELKWNEVDIGYQGKLVRSTSPKKTDSSDKKELKWLFHTGVSTKNTEKLVDTIISEDKEEVEHAINKAIQIVHV